MIMAEERIYEGVNATKADIAKRFHVSTRTVGRWIKAGTIPYHDINGFIRFNLHEVDDFFALSTGVVAGGIES